MFSPEEIAIIEKKAQDRTEDEWFVLSKNSDINQEHLMNMRLMVSINRLIVAIDELTRICTLRL